LNLNLRALPDEAGADELWPSLPGPAQAELLSLFARLIARGAVAEDEHEKESKE
jgi:hypothetical protein